MIDVLEEGVGELRGGETAGCVPLRVSQERHQRPVVWETSGQGTNPCATRSPNSNTFVFVRLSTLPGRVHIQLKMVIRITCSC